MNYAFDDFPTNFQEAICSLAPSWQTGDLAMFNWIRCTRSATWLAGIVGLGCLAFGAVVSADNAHSALWGKLRHGGHFVMIRHALAPGNGDPAHFDVDQCETQRNLSEKGREQARHMGELFRQNGIATAHVYSSQWCRCRDTATLLDLGPVKELPILNSFYQHFEKQKPQTEALTAWLEKQPLTTPLVLVTHQVNITAFTNIFPSSGEMVIVRRHKNGDFVPVGSIETD